MQRIGKTAFSECISLQKVEMHGDGVVNVGPYAFYNCKDLQDIEFGRSLTSIGRRAFSGCSNLDLVVFHGKTMTDVKAMPNYPWDIRNESAITCIP